MAWAWWLEPAPGHVYVAIWDELVWKLKLIPSVARVCSTMQEQDDLFTPTVSHERDGVFSKGVSMASTERERERDWYMVSSLMTKHVRPLGRGRTAGSDGVGVHSAQFRKLQTPEMEPEVNSQVNVYIHIIFNTGWTGLQNAPREGNWILHS